MKGKDLIKVIKDNNLEDFEISVIFHDGDGYNTFPVLRCVNIKRLADIGNSSKVAYLDGKLDE